MKTNDISTGKRVQRIQTKEESWKTKLDKGDKAKGHTGNCK